MIRAGGVSLCARMRWTEQSSRRLRTLLTVRNHDGEDEPHDGPDRCPQHQNRADRRRQWPHQRLNALNQRMKDRGENETENAAREANRESIRPSDFLAAVRFVPMTGNAQNDRFCVPISTWS
jgi:hypothetical protein